ncbi:DNA-binding bromodomain-containing protein [Trifolium repens]|nr:DNA-binding bromodomain-containing protein [Trifolium repens]KAK2396256.1 DNA-binding bromodomain-containing protein [Trifolium repens]
MLPMNVTSQSMTSLSGSSCLRTLGQDQSSYGFSIASEHQPPVWSGSNYFPMLGNNVILRACSKMGRKSYVQGYERRTTYNMSNLPVRLGEYSYGRSLARFSATLGPTAWRIAYQKIQQALPILKKRYAALVLHGLYYAGLVLCLASLGLASLGFWLIQLISLLSN